MPDIIQRLKAAYISNPASALDLIPEVIQAHDEGLIKVLPCKVGDKVLLDTEIMGCEIGKMPFKITDILFLAYGNFGSATQERNLTFEAAEKALESET